ncbi:DNA primase [Clostridiales Family XIII bacterium PM5-7]
MNVIQLNEHLFGNKNAIEQILESVGCANISYNSQRNEIRCSREEGKNPTGVLVDVENLKFKCFSTNEGGTIYNLVMYKMGISFPQALHYVADVLGIDKQQLSRKIELPFGGFYKDLIRSSKEPELNMETYDIEILKQYGSVGNMRFAKDGIDFTTQEKFHLGYDVITDRITVPQWSFSGELVGIMGRSNINDVPDEYRWLPIIPCSRGYTIFGYHQNYSKIQQQQLCIISESEKGVMQMSSMGYNYGLATCTNHISTTQEKYIKALMVDKIVVAYDQGMSEDLIRYEASKLIVDNAIYKNKVGYIYDKDGEILNKNKKDSPTDLGKQCFQELMRNYIKWL